MIEEKTRVTNSRECLQELLDAPEHVYFIYSAGLVKIGYSTNWRARFDDIYQGCSHHAELILVMPGDRKLERDYHTLFAESRMGGEWFRLEGNVRRFLEIYASEVGRENLEFSHQDFLEMNQSAA